MKTRGLGADREQSVVENRSCSLRSNFTEFTGHTDGLELEVEIAKADSFLKLGWLLG